MLNVGQLSFKFVTNNFIATHPDKHFVKFLKTMPINNDANFGNIKNMIPSAIDNSIKKLVKDSYIHKIFLTLTKIDIDALWLDSAIFAILSLPLNKIVKYKKREIPFLKDYIGIFILITTILSSALWSDVLAVILLFIISFLFIVSPPNTDRKAKFFIAISSIFLLILSTALLSPHWIAKSVVYLLTSIGFSSLIVHSCEVHEDVTKIIKYIFWAMILASYFSMLNINTKKEFAYEYTQILIMFAPTSLAYVLNLKSNKKKLIHALIFLPCAITGISLAFMTLKQYYNSDLYSVLNIITAYFKNGIGFSRDNFMQMYSSQSREEISFNSYLYYCKLFLKIGTFGILIFLWNISRLLKKGVSQLCKRKTEKKILLAMNIATLVWISTQSIFNNIWSDHKLMIYYWILLGITVANIKINQRLHDLKNKN